MGREDALTPRRADPRSVLRALRARFPRPTKPALDPLDELVLTILSQSTTDTNRDRAWARLAERFPASDDAASGGDHGPGRSGYSPVSWELVRRSRPDELEETVRVAGLAGQKSAAIRGALERLSREVGGPTLDHLAEMDDGQATDYLTSFRGVGRKTAACVLCFSLRRDVLPVDTHVLRIARRLGWVPPSATATRAHDLLAEQIQAPERFDMHMLLIALGRATCTARSPSCAACPLESECPKIGVPTVGAAARGPSGFRNPTGRRS